MLIPGPLLPTKDRAQNTYRHWTGSRHRVPTREEAEGDASLSPGSESKYRVAWQRAGDTGPPSARPEGMNGIMSTILSLWRSRDGAILVQGLLPSLYVSEPWPTCYTLPMSIWKKRNAERDGSRRLFAARLRLNAEPEGRKIGRSSPLERASKQRHGLWLTVDCEMDPLLSAPVFSVLRNYFVLLVSSSASISIYTGYTWAGPDKQPEGERLPAVCSQHMYWCFTCS